MAWVPGHIGYLANELADRLAKQKAEEVWKGTIEADSVIFVNGALRLARDMANKSWQRYWDRSESGVHAQMIIHQVNTKLLFPRNRNTGISYCRLLLGDTMLNYDSFRCGVADDPMCSFAKETETIEHFLLHCPLYADQRKLFFRALTLFGPLLEHVVHGKELYNSLRFGSLP